MVGDLVHLESITYSLTQPSRLYSRSGILARPSPVPREPGLYAWYFRDVPPLVPIDGCIQVDGLTLLYVGICPSAPPRDGRSSKTRTLRDRVLDHMRGNASGSTLRLTLGCLLSESLGIELQRVGSGTRLAFADGEKVLSDWLDRNAFVAWVEDPEPWIPEPYMIQSLSLPLNIDHNRDHPFYGELKAVRAAAKERARGQGIVG